MNQPAIPAQTLLQGKPYVRAAETDLWALFERIKRENDQASLAPLRRPVPNRALQQGPAALGR